MCWTHPLAKQTALLPQRIDSLVADNSPVSCMASFPLQRAKKYLLATTSASPVKAWLWGTVALLDEPEAPLALTREELALRPRRPMMAPCKQHQHSHDSLHKLCEHLVLLGLRVGGSSTEAVMAACSRALAAPGQQGHPGHIPRRADQRAGGKATFVFAVSGVNDASSASASCRAVSGCWPPLASTAESARYSCTQHPSSVACLTSCRGIRQIWHRILAPGVKHAGERRSLAAHVHQP